MRVLRLARPWHLMAANAGVMLFVAILRASEHKFLLAAAMLVASLLAAYCAAVWRRMLP